MIRDRLYVDGRLYQNRDELAMDDAPSEATRSAPRSNSDSTRVGNPASVPTARTFSEAARSVLTMTARVLVIHQAKTTDQVPIKGVGRTVELN